MIIWWMDHVEVVDDDVCGEGAVACFHYSVTSVGEERLPDQIKHAK